MSLLLFLAEGAHADTHFLLDPHGVGLVFWTAVTFSVVLLALHKLAWGPLTSALDQREAAIAGQVADSRRIRDEAEAVRLKYEAQLEGIRREAQKIIDEGEADRKRIVADAHTKAEHEARDIKDRAERDIRLSKQKALAEVKTDAVSMAMQIAERVIGAEVDQGRHQVIVDEVLTPSERSK